MSLLDLAESDNAIILEDTVNGFGRSATFTPPTGAPIVLDASNKKGVQYIRRGFKISPTTGLPVASDEAAITARISSIISVETGLPIMPVDGWTVTVLDSTGATVTYKISKGTTMQDRTSGRVTFADLKRIEV